MFTKVLTNIQLIQRDIVGEKKHPNRKGQPGLRNRLFAEAAELTEEEAVAMIDKKTRLFLQTYVEMGSAPAAYKEIYKPPPDRNISHQPYRILEQPKNAAYVKLLKLRAAANSIITLEELARWLSMKVLDNTSESLKAADQLAKLAGFYSPPETQQVSGNHVHEVVLSLATPPIPAIETVESIEAIEVID